MEPLSDVLSLVKPHSYMFRGIDAGGQWSIEFPAAEGVKCYAVVSGQFWLAVEGVADPVRLTAGDCVLLPRGLPSRMASDLALPPTDAKLALSNAREGGVATIGDGGDGFGMGGYFAFAGHHADILLGVLPPIVHIRKESDKTALRWCLEQMMQALRDPQPGGLLIAQRLAHLMLIQALRLYMAEGPRGGVGWLFALGDRQMSAAITAMHEEPARPWTLQAMAACAGMSRSSFAVRFRETVSATPMEYLTRWRMLVAGDRLVNTGEPVSAIALSLGYESESAFSTAFKRLMACSPRQYGRHLKPASRLRSAGDRPRALQLETAAG